MEKFDDRYELNRNEIECLLEYFGIIKDDKIPYVKMDNGECKLSERCVYEFYTVELYAILIHKINELRSEKAEKRKADILTEAEEIKKLDTLREDDIREKIKGCKKMSEYIFPKINLEDYAYLLIDPQIDHSDGTTGIIQTAIKTESVTCLQSHFKDDLLEILDKEYNFDEVHRKAITEVLGGFGNKNGKYDGSGNRIIGGK
jgi:hypothetical protein